MGACGGPESRLLEREKNGLIPDYRNLAEKGPVQLIYKLIIIIITTITFIHNGPVLS